MAVNLTGRNLVSMRDLTCAETLAIIELAQKLKRDRAGAERKPPLKNKTLAMIFQKPSLRTRVSFEAGVNTAIPRTPARACAMADLNVSSDEAESTSASSRPSRTRSSGEVSRERRELA